MIKKPVFYLYALFLLLPHLCPAQEAYQDLLLEEKVGQILMVHFRGEEVNEDAKTIIQDLHIGSIIYYNWANGLNSLDQVRNLSQNLQKLSKLPLLIAIDQEGGRVSRLKSISHPAQQEIAQKNDLKTAKEIAHFIGMQIRSCGINMNLAPVVDINSNPLNPIIGDRSFGNSADVVITYANQTISGYKKAGIATCLKHFPGHGDTFLDSHIELPIIHKSLDELKKMELRPFAALCKQADAIMTAHLLVPSMDPFNCSTLSKKTLDILRNEFGFQGVIISDSLAMQGVLKTCSYSFEDASIKAFLAGCDLLILGGRQLTGQNVGLELTLKDVERVHKALVQAVKDGRIPQKRLDESVDRILHIKKNLL